MSSSPLPVPQAGAVVFRVRKGVVEILLVRPRDGSDAWILPKGHVEPLELETTTALREAREEAGVEGVLIGPVDHASVFMSGDEWVAVRYYVVEMTAGTEPAEKRARAWLPRAAAAEMLTHDDARRILEDAQPLIERHLATTGRGDAAFDEFLLKELEHTSDSFLRSEEDGERRVTVFLAVATGVGAALAFVKGDHGSVTSDDIDGVVIVALAALFVVGYFTVVRVVKRNRASDDYKRQMNRLRQWFVPNAADPRRNWVPFDPYAPVKERIVSAFHPNTGGWLEFLVLILALIGGALAAAIVPSPTWGVEAIVAALSAAFTWLMMSLRARALTRRTNRSRAAP